jgi:hypothetical protein
VTTTPLPQSPITAIDDDDDDDDDNDDDDDAASAIFAFSRCNTLTCSVSSAFSRAVASNRLCRAAAAAVVAERSL